MRLVDSWILSIRPIFLDIDYNEVKNWKTTEKFAISLKEFLHLLDKRVVIAKIILFKNITA